MRAAPPNTLILGVLNVTPDSFSDGGLFSDRDRALAHAERLWRDGADIIDVGGESTRPGAAPVSEAQEAERILPIVEAIRSRLDVAISIDTYKPAIAREAVRLGATVVNDVTGGRHIEPDGFPPGTRFLLMHLRGTPADMQAHTDYPRGVVTEVREFLSERVAAFERAGVARENLWVDPGIGFAKTAAQSLALLRDLDALAGIGGRIAIGTSRKSCLSSVRCRIPIGPAERGPGTLASCLWAYTRGASVFRVHEPGELRRALATWEAIDASQP